MCERVERRECRESECERAVGRESESGFLGFGGLNFNQKPKTLKFNPQTCARIKCISVEQIHEKLY